MSLTATPGVSAAAPGNVVPGFGATFGRATAQATGFDFLPTFSAPYYAVLWNGGPPGNGGVAIQSLPMLDHPPIHYQINGGYAPMTFNIATDVGSAAAGVWFSLYEQWGSGKTIFQGQIQDTPYIYGSGNSALQLVVNGMVDHLALGIYNHDYTSSATDVGTIFADIVSQSPYLTYATQVTGVTTKYNFNQVSLSDALNICISILGKNWYWFCDVYGTVRLISCTPSTTGANYTFRAIEDFQSATISHAIDQMRNSIYGLGSGGIHAQYSGSSISQYGKRALYPILTYPDLSDSTTLNTIVASVGAALDRVIRNATITLNNYGQKIDLGVSGGATANVYFGGQVVGGKIPSGGSSPSPASGNFTAIPGTSKSYPDNVEPGYGATATTQGPVGTFWSTPFPETASSITKWYGSNAVVVTDVVVNGPQQTIQCGDLPVTLDDLNYMIDNTLARLISNG